MNVLVICRVSFWVGISISVWGILLVMLILDSIGIVNVVVLLVLVCVSFIMLEFVINVGIVVVWIVVGDL